MGRLNRESAGGLMEVIGDVELSVGGSSLKVDSLSKDLDPTADVYSYILIVISILGGGSSAILTGKINGSTAQSGAYNKNVAGTVTDATFQSTTLPISFGEANVNRSFFTVRIGCSATFDNVLTLNAIREYIIDQDNSGYGSGKIKTTASSTFTGFEIISSNDMGIGSRMVIYGVKYI